GPDGDVHRPGHHLGPGVEVEGGPDAAEVRVRRAADARRRQARRDEVRLRGGHPKPTGHGPVGWFCFDTGQRGCRMRRLVLAAVLVLAPAAASVHAEETPESLMQKAQAVLAQLDGEITVEGLKEPVEVLRDRWGVPHIYAKNQDDLFFAQGF